MIYYLMLSTVALVMLAGAAKAVCDSLMFRTDVPFGILLKRLFPDYWMGDTEDTWKNKWKDGDKSKGERFWGSSTFFVCFTDAWHAFQCVYHIALYTALSQWFVYGLHMRFNDLNFESAYLYILYTLLFVFGFISLQGLVFERLFKSR